MSRTEVYVGGVPRETRERDLERFFKGFGRLKRISLKNRFAFVEFESSRDAEDAIYEMNGKKLLDKRVTLDVARGKPRGRDRSNARSYQDREHFRRGQRRPVDRGLLGYSESRSRASPVSPRRDPSTPGSDTTHDSSRSPGRGWRRRAESSSKSPGRGRSRRRISSHSGTELSSRPRSSSGSSQNLVKHSRRHKNSSESRSRSGSINSLQYKSSSTSSEESGTRCKKRSGSSFASRSPAKRVKLVEKIQGNHCDSHVPENTSEEKMKIYLTWLKNKRGGMV